MQVHLSLSVSFQEMERMRSRPFSFSVVLSDESGMFPPFKMY